MPDFHSAPPGFEGPKLKDYLPFMKPKTFGKGRVNTGSLPSSLMSSPVHPPPSPDSVPASPQHGMGMSDDEMRKLGITDPMLGTVFCIGTCGKESAGFVATGLGGGSESTSLLIY
jgi:hypothetical protein